MDKLTDKMLNKLRGIGLEKELTLLCLHIANKEFNRGKQEANALWKKKINEVIDNFHLSIRNKIRSSRDFSENILKRDRILLDL